MRLCRAKKQFTLCFCILLFLTSCNRSPASSVPGNTGTPVSTSLPLPSSGEILDSAPASLPGEAMAHRLSLYDADGSSLYIKWDTEWLEVGGDSVRTLCRDPLCSHTSPTCLNVLASPSNAIYRYGEELFFLGAGSGSAGQNFIQYSLTDAKVTVIAEYDTGGLMIGRLGNYIYYFTLRFDEPDDSGHSKSWRQIYRYHVKSGELVFLGERDNNNNMTWMTGAGERLWWRDSLYHLVSADANLAYVRTEVGERTEIYALNGDAVYYLTAAPKDGEAGDLRVKNLGTGEEKTLFTDVTWFACDGDSLWYSLYDPAEGFSWDIRNNATGKTELHPITVKHGNRIYRIELESLEKTESKPKGQRITALDALTNEGIWLGEVFTVVEGRLFTQYRMGYESNGKHGMKTGMFAVDSDTGEYVTISEETVFNS